MGDGPADEPTDRAAEGLAHLQAAAREFILAARAMLDVAEELVDDPGTVRSVADAVGGIVRTAAQAGRNVVAPSGDEAGGGVEHITISE
jgi:hypothetical protein